MSAFSSNETDALKRIVDVQNFTLTPENQIHEIFEISNCVSWIKRNNIVNVALQFPDDMLCDAAKVSLQFEKHLGRIVYILGDTTYGSCCVDEIAAEHVGANGVIHFGHACLSPTQRLPVLHIFTPLRNSFTMDFMKGLDSKAFGGIVEAFEENFDDSAAPLILACDVNVAFLMSKIVQVLSVRFSSLIITQLCVDTGSVKAAEKCGSYCELNNKGKHNITCLGRSFCLPEAVTSEYSHITPPLVYFGEESISLDNLALTLRNHECYRCYVKEDGGFVVSPRFLDETNKFLRRRLFLVEKVREANIIGVVIGTLGTEGYLKSAEHVMSRIRNSGRKGYLLALGRPTPPKLANFLEIDVFVVIACPESARALDLRGQFHRPVVTPYEVEVALGSTSNAGDETNSKRWEKWGGLDFIPDFRDLLRDADPDDEHKSENLTGCETDVSLLSGRIRSFGVTESENIVGAAESSEKKSSSDVAIREDMPLAVIHIGGGGEFLAGRTWKGLEISQGKSSPAVVVPGRLGTASGYRTEEESLYERFAVIY